MFEGSTFRGAAALALATVLVACGDSDTTGPGLVQPQPSAPRLSVIEALIQFTSGDDTPAPDPLAPAFSLATLPSTVMQGQGWSRTIAIEEDGPFAPNVAVDFGDGAGARNVTVNVDDGGGMVLPPPGEACIPDWQPVVIDGEPYFIDANDCPVVETPDQPEVSYSFNLTHTYSTPGRYTVAVAASNTEGTQIRTHTIAVTEDPALQLHIENFAISSPVVAGQPAEFSFDAIGPGEDLFSVAVSYYSASGSLYLTQNSFVAPGGTKTRTYTWDEPGTFDLRMIITNGAKADTLTQSVTVEPAPRTPPSLDNVQFPQETYVGQEAEISFATNDPDDGVSLTYRLEEIENGQATVLAEGASDRGEAVTVPVLFEQVGDHDLLLILTSVKEGVTKADSVAHTLTVIDLVCVAGTYRDGFDCVEAPVGYHVPGAGALEAIPCPAGSYQNQPGQIACIPAPAGSVVAIPGSAEATLCAAGTFQDQEGATACKPAPAGYFVADVGATGPEICAAGTFQPATGSTWCEPAPLGHYVASPGATSAEPCVAGTFAANAGQSACEPAPLGSFVGQPGQSQAQLCPAGSYSNIVGAAACEPAPLGSFVGQPGQSQAQLCPAGSYSNVVGAAACEPAPVGSYVDFAGATQATACPIATSTLATGSTSVDQCIALGQVTLVHVDEAVSNGTLAPSRSGRGGEQQFDNWVRGLTRSVGFLEGPQFQAGCSGVRNALARADGDRSPPDVVTGAARADIVNELRRILEENGCRG